MSESQNSGRVIFRRSRLCLREPAASNFNLKGGEGYLEVNLYDMKLRTFHSQRRRKS